MDKFLECFFWVVERIEVYGVQRLVGLVYGGYSGIVELKQDKRRERGWRPSRKGGEILISFFWMLARFGVFGENRNKTAMTKKGRKEDDLPKKTRLGVETKERHDSGARTVVADPNQKS